MALALVKQLEQAESVVHDLFLEATDDGIEALEAVLEACRQSVDTPRAGDRGGCLRPASGREQAPRARSAARPARRGGGADSAPPAEPADGSADPSAA